MDSAKMGIIVGGEMMHIMAWFDFNREG